MALRMLSFAAASGKIAHVYLIGDQLHDWRISDAPRASEAKAIAWVERQLEELQPNVVLTEDIRFAKKKGDPARQLTDAISRLAEDRGLLNPRIKRDHAYANKYEEAEAIVKHYPELKPWLSKRWRRFFDNEPRNTVLFEAMSYAMFVLRNPTPALARAMG